jgi:thymidine phosphorylase
VGITVLAKLGDLVEQGQPLARLLWANAGKLNNARALAAKAFELSDEPAAAPELILGEVR